jgi:diguanylate cyclase (GGDEF)-like protein
MTNGRARAWSPQPTEQSDAREKRELVLVADDHKDIVSFIEGNLRLEGFNVATAADGEQALQTIYDVMPDLVLLDVMMPKMDGFEVCQRVRADPRTKFVSVIMLTAKSLSADKVVGLTAGADDYIIKPFDPIELIARVNSALRRSREMRAINPLTQLPGNVQVQEEVAKAISDETPFALMYIDLDHFKAFNDYYGFLRGDEAIKLLAKCASQAVQHQAGPDAFVGHVGGDDFVAVVDWDVVETTCKELIAAWDEAAPALYEPEDSRRGYIEVANRRNELHRFPLATVSIGVATNARRRIANAWEASEIAAEMKMFAKRQAGSAYAVDRRTRNSA